MAIWKRNVWIGSAAVICLMATGCQRESSEPTVSLVSAEEVARLLEQAEKIEPMGEATVERYPHEGGTTVVCRQPLRLHGGGLGRTGIVHCCTGSCKLDVACKSCDNSLLVRW